MWCWAVSLHCRLVTPFKVALLPWAWCWESPCYSLVLPIPFPAMHCVGPELIMSSCPFRITLLPEWFCPLPLVGNPRACHILPFTFATILLPAYVPQDSLRQAPYNSKASIRLGALLSPALSLTVAHPFKTMNSLKIWQRCIFPFPFLGLYLWWHHVSWPHNANRGQLISYISESFLQGFNFWPCYSLRGWGRWLFTWLLQFTHGHLSFLLVFFEEASQSLDYQLSK